ncbi:T9SS type A sorting domain-containing protein [Winogradskyella sp.]|uniref:T9SS type A sorting domain-containing protein n=1 Tax=Winogradskyella sp. TaxID=1883156 RepID=UPI003BA9747C
MKKALLFFGIIFSVLIHSQGPPPPCGATPYTVCEDDGDGFAEFNLVSYYPFTFCVSPDAADQYFPTKYYESESDAINDINAIPNPESYTNVIPFIQEIWFRADKINPGQGPGQDVLYKNEDLSVKLKPTISEPSPLIACEGNESGFAVFDLSSKRNEILAGQNDFFLSFFETIEDAINLNNPLPSEFTNTNAFQQTIYASVYAFDSPADGNCTEVVELDLIVDTSCEDIAVNIVRISPRPRPGFSYKNRLYISNVATADVVNGTVEFLYDENLIYDSMSISDNSLNITAIDNGFTVMFNDLDGYDGVFIDFFFTVPVDLPLGYIITNSAQYLTNENDVNNSNDTSILNEVVIGSYDPNDIFESRGTDVLYDDFIISGEYLYYTIRFQNIGTAEAIDVSIENEIDMQLDETTFQMLQSSHSESVLRVGNTITWNFDGINLPAEQDDEEGSNGFVNYRIKPKAGYAPGDIIPNSAAIYFDFNAPIITNTFTTTFVETLSIDDSLLTEFIIYPNPAKDKVIVSLDDSSMNNADISLIDIQGEVIDIPKVNHTHSVELNVSSLNTGLYFIHLKKSKGTLVRKLIIE